MTSDSASVAAAPNARPLYETRPGSTELVSASLGQPLKQIADSIWQSDGVSNSYLITTSEGDVVINTGLVVEGHIHRQKFDQVSRAPVRAVVVTQATPCATCTTRPSRA